MKPALPKVDALLAMSLSELGRYDEALPAVTKAFSQSADPVLQRMAGLHLQRIYTGLGRDRDAVDVALRLSQLHPDDPEVLYHSGRLFANFAYLQTMRLATVAPDSVWLHQAAGEANESQGLYDAAIREYRQVLTAAPRRPGIHFRIGRVLLERSNNAASSPDAPTDALEARTAFEEELALDPTNANAAYELAEMHRKAGELDSARTLFEQAVSHYPAFEQALIGLGRTLVALGRPADALPHLQAALKAIQTTRSLTIKPRRHTGHSGNRRSRRKRWPSSTGCAPSPHGALPPCPNKAGGHAAGARPQGSKMTKSRHQHRRVLCSAAVIAGCVTIVPMRAIENPTFTDITKATGIAFSHVSSPDKKYILESMSGGVAVFDFDHDGLLDVYLVNSHTVATARDPRSARSELWRNRGDGTFVDVTDKAGVGYPGWGMGVVVGDIDNDGWDDLYVTCYGPNRLYRNNGDGTFVGCDRQVRRRGSTMVDRCRVRRLRRRRVARSVRGQLRRRAARRPARVR